jgi:hypothetical protein
LKLIAYISPDQCPHLETRVKIVNRRVLRIKNGWLTFYVTPDVVVVCVKVLANNANWDYIGKKFETSFYEIKTNIEAVIE